MKGNNQKGVTLIELTVVLLILIALAGLTIPYIGGTSRKVLCDATDVSMANIKKAIMDRYYLDTLGYFPKDTKDKTVLTDYSLEYLMTKPDGWLVFDPDSQVGWRGPYVQGGKTNSFAVDGDDDSNKTDELHSSFGNPTYINKPVAVNDLVVWDAWGRPIVIQVPSACPAPYASTPEKCARLVSAGPVPGRDIQNFGLTAKLNNGAATDRGTNRVLFLLIPDPDPNGNESCND